MAAYPDSSDIIAVFNSDFYWYYGTDGNPEDYQVDFISIVLHELGHGLGFIGGGWVDPYTGEGYVRYDTFPLIYDHFVVNGEGNPILSFDDPSFDLAYQLTSENLFMAGKNTVEGFARSSGTMDSLALPKIFAPYGWQYGSSYSHWDEYAFLAGDVNSLMTPYFDYNEVIHQVGPITIGLFKDMGWEVNGQAAIALRQTVQASGGKHCDSLPVAATDYIMVTSNTEVCYYYTVRNAGDFPLNLHDLEDERIGTIFNALEYELMPGDSLTISKPDTIENYSVFNMATWTAYNPGPANVVMAQASSYVEVTASPVASVTPEVLIKEMSVNEFSVEQLTLKNEGEGWLDFFIAIKELKQPFTKMVEASN
jgi:hypothetical protein